MLYAPYDPPCELVDPRFPVPDDPVDPAPPVVPDDPLDPVVPAAIPTLVRARS
jgi:hypothetical protein